MRINITGDDITPENIAKALAICERDHGHKIKKATIYVRYEDALGREIEPLQDGHEICRSFHFQKPRAARRPQPIQEVRPEPVNPISAGEMIELSRKAARRMLSSPEMKTLITFEKVIKLERDDFLRLLSTSMQQEGRFNIHHLEKLVSQHIRSLSEK